MSWFRQAFAHWVKLAHTSDFHGDSPYRPFRTIIAVLSFLHFALVLYMYYADAAEWWSILLVILLLGGAAVMAVIHTGHKGYTAAVLIGSLFAGAYIVDNEVFDRLMLLVLASLILLWRLPRHNLNSEYLAYYYAIRRWRRQLKKTVPDTIDRGSLERHAQAALITGVSPSFIQQLRQTDSDLLSVVPLLQPAAIAAIQEQYRIWNAIPLAKPASRSGGGHGGGGYGGGGGWDSGSDNGGDSGGGGDGGGGGGGD